MFQAGLFAVLFLFIPPATQPTNPNGQLEVLGTRHFTSGYRFIGAGFSPDGKLMVTAHTTGPAIMWDVATGARLFRIDAPDQPAHTSDLWNKHDPRIANARDATFLGADRFLIAWQPPLLSAHKARTGEILFNQTFDQEIRRLVASPDGSRFVVVLRDSTTQLWDGEEFKPIANLGTFAKDEPYSTRSGLTFTADSKTVLTVGADKAVHLWSAKDGAAKETPAIEAGYGNSATITPDGKTIVVVGRSVRTFDATSGNELLPPPRIPPTRPDTAGYAPTFGAMSPDDAHIAFGGTSICLFDLAKNQLNAMIEATSPDLIWSPNERFLASPRNETSLEIWDVADPAHPKPLEASRKVGDAQLAFSPHGINSLALTKDGGEVLLGDYEGNLSRWDVSTGKLLASDAATRANNRATILQIVPLDEKQAIILEEAGRMSLVDPTTLEKIDTGDERRSNARKIQLFGANGEIVVQQNGDDLKIRVWNRQTKADIVTIPGSGTPVGALALSPDQKQLAIGMPEVVRVFSLPDGKQMFSINTPQRVCDSAIFSPDGKSLFASFMGLHAYDAHDGRPLWKNTSIWPLTLCCSDDSALLAGAGEENPDAWIVDAGSGEPVLKLANAHEAGVTQLKFLGDHRRLISAGADTTAIVWDYRAALLAGAKDESIDELWTDLAADDASIAWRAAAVLASRPRDTMQSFADHMPLDQPSKYAQLIHQLSADDPKVRESAHRALEAAGPAAASAVRNALAHPPSGEAGERLKAIARVLGVDENGGQAIESNQRLQARAKMVLRWIDTPDARARLDRLSQSATTRP